ncbi:MAG TPA: glycerate kinase, partial [Longimicrobiales bacterium]|nr:glycerate kinase [Longimicrobiales bacterium]
AATLALPEDAELVVGLGGSATVDAGAGLAYALGWRLLDEDGEPILPCGSGLRRLDHIEPPPLSTVAARPRVLADVTNPLLGPAGAAPVFGPQKGASPRDIPVLETGLQRWADVVRRDLGADVADLPGGGAAGGLGAALAALFDVPVEPGAEWVLEAVDFNRLLDSAQAVVTGEGAWDEQSSMGKITGAVIRRARERDVPVLVVAGAFDAPLPPGVVGRGGVELDEDGLVRETREGLEALLGGAG